MVVIGERQLLDVVVHAVAQVIADPHGDPLGQIAVSQVQYCGGKPKSEEEKRRANEVIHFAAHKSIVDHGADDARHDQAESGQSQQQEHGRQDLPHVWFEKDAYSEEVFHRREARIP
jgi:hypothetical protein